MPWATGGLVLAVFLWGLAFPSLSLMTAVVLALFLIVRDGSKLVRQIRRGWRALER